MSDLLTVMGKSVNTTAGSDGWNTAAAYGLAWLVADDIKELIIGYAEGLRSHHLIDLILLGHLAGVDLWFVLDSVASDGADRAAGHFSATVVSADEFCQTRRAPTAETPDSPEQRRFPDLPRDEVMSFLTTCREQLPDADFRAVCAAFDQGFAYREGLGKYVGNVSEEAIAELLHSALDVAGSNEEALAIARGFQAAAIQRGLRVRLDLRRFLNRTPSSLTVGRLTPQDWLRLAAFGRPRTAACAVLSLLGLSVERITSLSADDVAFDGSEIREEGRTIEVAFSARPFLVAQHLLRLGAGDATSGLYLSGDRKQKQYSRHSVSLELDKISQLTGLPIRARHDRWSNDRKGWRQRYGLSVDDLTCD